MLEKRVATFGGSIEARRADRGRRDSAENASNYGLVPLAGSQDRSVASRLVSPAFEQIEDLERDVAIVDRG